MDRLGPSVQPAQTRSPSSLWLAYFFPNRKERRALVIGGPGDRDSPPRSQGQSAEAAPGVRVRVSLPRLSCGCPASLMARE